MLGARGQGVLTWHITRFRDLKAPNPRRAMLGARGEHRLTWHEPWVKVPSRRRYGGVIEGTLTQVVPC